MKKILFLCYTFSMGNGSERILSDLVGNIDTDKYEVTILPYADFHVKQEAVPEGVRLLPAIVDMTKAGKLEKGLKFLAAHLCPSLLHRLYVRDRYDVEISFNYQIPSFIVGRGTSAKTVNWVHGDVYDLRKGSLKYRLQCRSFKRAARIVSISQNTETSIAELFPLYRDKLVRIYNGINIPRIRKFAQAECEHELLPNSVIFLGRLEHNKQPLALLEAARILKEKGLRLNFYFLGEGEQRSDMEKRIDELGLSDRAFLLGYQQNPYPYIAQADVVCMLSKTEGFPTVFAEGMALGKPFISSDVGGVAEMSCDGKCGIIANTPEECAAAIEKIVLDREIYAAMSEECLRRIDDFSMEKQHENLEKLLSDL